MGAAPLICGWITPAPRGRTRARLRALIVVRPANHNQAMPHHRTPSADSVARIARPGDDVEQLTNRELYGAGLISASELHATGSPELLPKGWYQHYVEALDEYCPTRVFSLEEAGTDTADLYAQGYRWMVVFSTATGPRGDHTFLDVRSFAAAAMTEHSTLTEHKALDEIAAMGYRLDQLPKHVFLTGRPSPARPVQGWYPDPARRFHYRWWDGNRWSNSVASDGQHYADPI